VSLGGLADVAIDSDTAVIEDPEDERFYVVHDGYRYVYVPPGTDGTAPRVAAGDDDGGSDGRRDEAGDGETPESDAAEPSLTTG
jgi:hypothetical protein